MTFAEKEKVFKAVKPIFRKIKLISNIDMINKSTMRVYFRYTKAETYDKVRKQIVNIINNHKNLELSYVTGIPTDSTKYEYCLVAIKIK